MTTTRTPTTVASGAEGSDPLVDSLGLAPPCSALLARHMRVTGIAAGHVGPVAPAARLLSWLWLAAVIGSLLAHGSRGAARGIYHAQVSGAGRPSSRAAIQARTSGAEAMVTA
jgi:hypothetical protein